ncbi:MAG: response regulator [Oscillospiraceae bacterium]|nr:response regulator [Oscillospiraceae bacterium]
MQKLIFVVDDNDSNLTVAASALEGDFRVLTMPSAEKLFKLLEKKKPDLILLDIEMPEMDGFEAIAKLSENPDWQSIPVVFLTGRSDEECEIKARETRALGILKKPFSPRELISSVKNYVQ